ncbi:MAG: SDR family NAD(P)-dependent oxidoreductase [Rhizobiaceae bacterium]
MTQHFNLDGMVAIVTGGDSGIGLATAKRLSAAGASVAIAGLREAQELASEFGAHSFVCDVSNEKQVQTMLQSVRDQLGLLDIVVNNAGVNAGYGELANTEIKDFAFNWSVNTMGVAHCIKHAVPLMNDGGAIVNVASAAGLQGVAYLGPYVASKYAVIGLTRTAALELGHRNIRVNAVCPTSVNTPMAHAEGGEPQLRMEEKAVPLGRIAEPEEIAALIHFLCADDCGFVNGQAIAVDGGFTAGLSLKAYDILAAE